MANTLIGAFRDRVSADLAWRSLEEAGFDSSNVSILIKDGVLAGKDTSAGDNVATGAVSGAVTGGALAGLAGLLIGLGVIAIPGIGGLLIGGPLAAALGLTGTAATATSAAATGVVAGGLVGGLAGLGIPEDQATVFADHIKAGGVVLAVEVLDSAEEVHVENIFQQAGATSITTVASN